MHLSGLAKQTLYLLLLLSTAYYILILTQNHLSNSAGKIETDIPYTELLKEMKSM